MITKVQRELKGKEYAELVRLVADYKAFLITHEFELTFDVVDIALQKRRQLFAKLLQSNPLVAEQYAMLKDASAKEALVSRSVSEKGYEELEIASKYVAELKPMLNKFVNEYSISVELLVKDFSLDILKYLDSITINWSEFAEEKNKLDKLFKSLNELLHILYSYKYDEYYKHFSTKHFVSIVDELMIERCDKNEKVVGVEIDELRLYWMMKNKIQ